MARHPHACEALRLSKALTGGELLVLMASQRVAKRGVSHRIFLGSDLEKPSVLRPLRERGETLAQCLGGLVRKGMLAPRGRHGFEATTPGNIVKHTFNQVAMEMLVGTQGPALRKRPFEWETVLRGAVRRACERS